MNARQTKKRLKKQINKLQMDNDLMRRIIADSPAMQELYDAYNKPLNVTCTTMMFQEYRSKRDLLLDDVPYDAVSIALLKKELANDLLQEIKEHISYKAEADFKCRTQTITASIFIGIKEGHEKC